MHRIRRLNFFPDHQICRASFSHIVGSKTSKSVFFAVAVSVSAMLDIHVKKISLKLLFLSDISLFPFVRQQITVLA